MPSLTELRQKARELDDEVLQIRDEHTKLKGEGKTGDDAWGGSEKRTRFKKVMEEREVLRKQIDDEEEEQRAVAAADQIRRDREQEREGRGRPGGGLGDPPAGGNDGGGSGSRSAEERAQRLQRQRDLALRAWSCYGSPGFEMNDEMREACRSLNFSPDRNQLALDLSNTRTHQRLQRAASSMHPQMFELALEERSLSAHVGSTGGFTIGSTLVRALEVNMLAFSGVEQVAEVMITDTGEEMMWPSADDTSNEGEILGEDQTTASDEEPSFKKQRWAAYEFSSKAIKVPRPLLEDSSSPLEQLLPRMLAERIGRRGNRAFTTGIGGSTARGFLTAAEVGRTAASATAITGGDVIRLQHSIDPAYRNPNTSAFMMHDLIAMELFLLTDTTGQFIWQPGLRDGKPDRLLGSRVVYNQHMDSALAASNKVIAYGDFSYYKIRRVRRVFVTRLVEKYAENNQVAFLVILRQDGNLLNAGTCPIKYLKMAAS